MIKNYFKIAWRNLIKYRAFSFINIFGLSVAMSVCMLMILMFSDQLSYDQFHQNKDRIYRLASTPENEKKLRATIPFPVADKLKTDYPKIEETVWLRKGVLGDVVHTSKAANMAHFSEVRGYFATPSFLKVFTYSLESGDANTALDKPNSLIISQEKANKLFGNENPIGQTIRYTDRADESQPPVDWGLFTITGVFADKGQKSHLAFDAILSAATLNNLYKENKIEDLSNDWNTDHKTFAYVLLQKTANQNDLDKALSQISAQNFKKSDNAQVKESVLTYQKLSEINPGPVVNNSDLETLPLFVYYILGGLVLVILLASCLNYMSLSVARSFTRAKEIGLRKVIGAKRNDLVIQFLLETFLTVLLSLLLANVFLLFLKNAFLSLWINQYLKFDLQFNLYVYTAFFVFSLIISFISGVYPAFKLSKSSPMAMLKKLGSSSLGRWSFRRILTVSQFAISLVFIITSIVIYDQFKHYMSFDYGFNPKNVVNINLQNNDIRLVKNTFKNIKGVKQIASAAYLPSTGRNDGLELTDPIKKETKHSAIDLTIDQGFTKVMEIPILYGKNIATNNEDKSESILVNEEATRKFGFKNPAEIVGQTYTLNGKNVTVAGVCKDFTFFLLFAGRPTGPIVMHTNPEALKIVSVKIEGENTKAIIKDLENSWKAIDPIHPMQFEFYDETLANTNQGIFDLVSVIGFLAFLAITIACLGLLGMAIYTTERRTKEIGIRKVLGATELSLNFMLSKEFLWMLGFAILIAAPSAYFLNNLWLNFMVARANMTVVTIMLGSFIMLLLGLVTIVPQTYRIAKENPLKSLKME